MTHVVPHDLRDLPKAELHVHLEGSVRPATLEEFAARTGIAVPAFSSLASFIGTFSAAYETMTQPGDYRRMMREYCEDAVRSGVRYAEVQLRTVPRGYDCLDEAAEEAERQTDIEVRLVATAPRHLPVEVGWAMLEAARDCPRVVAMSLGGIEAGYPPEPFADLFAEARRRGLRSVPHAGEDAGAASIRRAIDALGADRIQHGISAIEDPALLRELVERGIPLDVCPTSNVRLGVAPSLRAHPIDALRRAGVRVSLNTDDPVLFASTVDGEYVRCVEEFGWGADDVAGVARTSIESCFADPGLCQDLLRDLAAYEGAAP